MLATEGVEQLDDTTLISKVNGSYDSAATDYNLRSELQKYFKVNSIKPQSNYVIHYLDGSLAGDYSHDDLLAFPDGAVIDSGIIYKKATTSNDYSEIQSAGGHLYNTQIEQLIIDVNGFKKPNIVGRDVFFFVLSGNGILYPREGNDWAIWEPAGKWYQVNGCGTNSADNSGIATSDGTGCAARIMESGWEMNY